MHAVSVINTMPVAAVNLYTVFVVLSILNMHAYCCYECVSLWQSYIKEEAVTIRQSQSHAHKICSLSRLRVQVILLDSLPP